MFQGQVKVTVWLLCILEKWPSAKTPALSSVCSCSPSKKKYIMKSITEKKKTFPSTVGINSVWILMLCVHTPLAHFALTPPLPTLSHPFPFIHALPLPSAWPVCSGAMLLAVLFTLPVSHLQLSLYSLLCKLPLCRLKSEF